MGRASARGFYYFSLSPFSSHGLRGGRGRDTGATLLSVAARGAIFSFSLAPINFYKLGGRGRNGGRWLLLSEATLLVCMSGSRERERVGRSVSLLWPFNCLLTGGGDKSSGGYLSTLGGGSFGLHASGLGGRAARTFVLAPLAPPFFRSRGWGLGFLAAFHPSRRCF